jgi:hypothetical protein
MCVAGCFMADAEYATKFEENSWSHLIRKYPDEVPADHADLIEGLQDVHDHETPEEWKKGLIQVAYDFSLDPKIVTEFEPA